MDLGDCSHGGQQVGLAAGAKHRIVGGAVWLLAAGSLALGVGACGSAPSSHAAPPLTVHEYVSLLDGGMVDNPGWPQLVPADLTLPAHATVVLTITSYDEGSAPLGSASSPFLEVTGGSETANGVSISAVPNTQIAHTFTVPGLGLNAPIPAATTAPKGQPLTPEIVVFTFKTGAAGSYTWRCETPCGSGPKGMGGPMDTKGYMMGTVTVN